MIRRGLRNERGGALLIVLAVMIMLTVAAMMAVKTAQTDIDLSFNQLHTDQAFYTAEAGLMQAFVTINQDNNWNTGYAGISFEDGVYSVAVVDSFAEPALFDTVILRSTGVKDQSVANLEAVVVPEYLRPFQYAMFGLDSVVMDNSTCTDSYNSDEGTYVATAENTDGDVASNGTMDFLHGATVGGDASSALEGGITIDATSVVYGDTSTTIDPYVVDPIPDSEYVWAQSVSQAPAGFTGDYSYNAATYELRLSTNDTLILDGGVYYFSDIVMQANATIIVPSGAQVTIYMTGDLTIDNNGSVNPSGCPADLVIFSQGTIFTLGMSCDITAAFYGPTADVTLSNSCHFYGSIVGKSVKIVNNACVHYDVALRPYEHGKTGVMTMLAWRQL